MNDSNTSDTPPVKGPFEKYCSECGSIINIKAEICPKCGVRQLYNTANINLGAVTANGRNRIVAALLAFFLGGFGVHKFYLGQIGWGIVYLLLCWTLVPAVVAFIEFILLLIMSDQEFNQRFGQS
jgi:TM2 domain-containing membrane protein YozV